MSEITFHSEKHTFDELLPDLKTNTSEEMSCYDKFYKFINKAE